jgi:GNAT superfamily N-acetyltransferase/uncharacterized glyoxalase superfamily protein PhnB
MDESQDAMDEMDESGEPTGPTAYSVEPILAVADVRASLAFYRDVLGFARPWLWGEPPAHGGIFLGRAHFQFRQDPERAAAAAGLSYFLPSSDVEALYEGHRERGAAIISPLESKPWGVREYTVRDDTGYHLRFSEPASPQGHSPRPLPTGLRILAEPPTLPEYEALIRAVGGEPWAQTAGTLAAAKFAVTARVDGQAIGCALLMAADPAFWYVRDVMVDPPWQGRGVGLALMGALAAWARANVPAGALVGLFTGQRLHRFYERFGFVGPEQGLVGMHQTIQRPG